MLLWNGKSYMLRNFNEQGIGLWVPSPAPFALSPGTEMSGDVVIGKDIFPVRLEIRHSSPGILGLRFTDISPELAGVFKRLMEPANYASQLEPHSKSRTEDSKFGHPRLWYSGPGGTELVVWYNDFQRMVMGLQLSFLGRWVFRSQFQEVRTGFLKDDFVPSLGIQIAESDLILRHEIADLDVLQEAAQFLASAPRPLPGGLLWQFLEMGEQTFLPEELIPASRVA